jgi:UDP-N-acetylglucosamine:LPS N-acetylglucosamine transferase
MSDIDRHPGNPPIVTAVGMGYGHLRAAAALADHWKSTIDRADRRPLANRPERLIWGLARGAYHSLSRWSQSGSRYSPFHRALDALTAIDDAEEDHSDRPPWTVRLLDTLIRRGFGAGLGRRLEIGPTPAVATFYANALAAERHSTVPVACVVTDSHAHRVWAPRHPGSSRVSYLVPVPGTAACLTAYGVRPNRVRVTGFPLPPELVGDVDEDILERNLARRNQRLRDRGSKRSPIRITIAVGGAGAQADHVRGIIDELHRELREDRYRLALVAGTHRWVAQRFRRWASRAIEAGAPGDAVEVLYFEDFLEYYRAFNRLLADTDLLWTKPSELTFYAGLGLPLILEAPVGDHERHNRRLAIRAGAGADRPPPGEITRWLRHGVENGGFATAAQAGRERLKACGTRNIASFCSTEIYGEFTTG